MWSYQDFDTRNKLQYKWALLTPTTLQTTQVKAQVRMERVDIDTQSQLLDFKQFTSYEWQVWLTNEFSSFQVQQKQTLSATTCRYLADSVTDSPMNRQGLEVIPGLNDLVFVFYVKQFRDCQGTLSVISDSLPELAFYPSQLLKLSGIKDPLSIRALSDTIVRDSIIEKTYELRISKKIQTLLPVYEPFRVLAT